MNRILCRSRNRYWKDDDYEDDDAEDDFDGDDDGDGRDSSFCQGCSSSSDVYHGVDRERTNQWRI